MAIFVEDLIRKVQNAKTLTPISNLMVEGEGSVGLVMTCDFPGQVCYSASRCTSFCLYLRLESPPVDWPVPLTL